MIPVYDQILEELADRQTYMANVYAPYYICSFAIHAFNLMNQRREVYFVGKQLPNMRVHMMWIAPSGFMKTHFGDVMGRDPHGIFHKTLIPLGSEQSMCLPAGELVQMADGSSTPIEMVSVGDQVLSYDSGRIVSTGVTATHVNPADTLVDILVHNGNRLQMTPTHPLLTKCRGWVQAKYLTVGEGVGCLGDNLEVIWDIIVGIKIIITKCMVYNISTATHTFIAGHQITHNTEAGFVGTIASVNGLAISNPGAAELNKDGILFIDEFKGIQEALKNQMNSQMETQLLAALDHGNVHKRLASGAITYKTNLTLWTGIQPGSYDLSSGLGRRLCVMIFVPTQTDNDAIMEIMHNTQNMKPDYHKMSLLWDNINTVIRNMETIQKIEIDDSVLTLYKKLNLFSFETSYFNRLIIGYHLMKYPIEPVMHMDVSDTDLMDILVRQKKWRGDVYKGLDYMQIEKILTIHGGKCERSQIAKECVMIGWNTKQVFEILAEMQKHQVISYKNNLVELK